MSKKSNIKSLMPIIFGSMVAVACGIYLIPLFAKEVTVKSDRRFQDLIINNQYAVLMLYKEDKETRKDKQLTTKLRQLRETFKAVSNEPFYKEADLLFLTINVADKEVNYIPNKLQIQKLPAFVIFKNSKPLRTMAGSSAGQSAILSGFVDRGNLQDFIDQNIGDDLEDVLDEKAEIRKRELEEAKIRSYYAPRFYVGVGYGYPYSWYPYGYYGGWGWGWGW